MDGDVPSISEDQTLRQAWHRLRELGALELPVRAADGTAHGTVSTDMIVRHIATGADPKTVTVADLAAVPGTGTDLWTFWAAELHIPLGA